jgi:hypothetical protein
LARFVALRYESLAPLAAFCHRHLPELAAICRPKQRSLADFHLSIAAFDLLVADSLTCHCADHLSCRLMNEKQHRGGRAFHSILEPHFDFIREQRQRRRTWQEIADLLFSEKGIRVTFYAPYHFYRRKLKRAQRPHWEDPSVEPQTARPSEAVGRPTSRRAPLPAPLAFKRPDIEQLNSDKFT